MLKLAWMEVSQTPIFYNPDIADSILKDLQ